MATSKQNMKRIHKVTIKRMVDESPDTSWLGEYASSSDSEFSIDRAHDLDCPQQRYNKPDAVIEQLERAITYLRTQDAKNGADYSYNDDAIDLLIESQDELAEECTCGFSGHWDSREYRYFNPSSNYKGESPEDTIKYVRQDYERMERLNAGDWCFIGIRAEAKYSVGESRGGYLEQEITSGGLWGIESDSDDSHLTSVEMEELADLRTQLEGIGFSKRAIAAAFKNVERKD